MTFRAIGAFAMLLCLASSAAAQVAMQGSFAASKACPALQSIKKGTNPGDVSVAAGQSYRLLGKNKDQATHYWIEVPGAQPLQRWVAVDCGSANGESPTTAGGGYTKQPKQETGKPGNDGKPFYVLALSWEPAFCAGMPDKAECKAETPQGYDATHLSLHGLWPQPRGREYCNVDAALKAADGAHRWEDLPEPALSSATKAALDHVMPGTQSVLERHEWIKHGTCYGADAETYFKDEVRLIDAVNASPVAAFLAANAGKAILTADLRAKFDVGFGAGAGQRLKVSCKSNGGGRVIEELTLGLKGDIPGGASINDLIAAASPTDPGCPGGVLVQVGSQ